MNFDHFRAEAMLMLHINIIDNINNDFCKEFIVKYTGIVNTCIESNPHLIDYLSTILDLYYHKNDNISKYIFDEIIQIYIVPKKNTVMNSDTYKLFLRVIITMFERYNYSEMQEKSDLIIYLFDKIFDGKSKKFKTKFLTEGPIGGKTFMYRNEYVTSILNYAVYYNNYKLTKYIFDTINIPSFNLYGASKFVIFELIFSIYDISNYYLLETSKFSIYNIENYNLLVTNDDYVSDKVKIVQILIDLKLIKRCIAEPNYFIDSCYGDGQFENGSFKVNKSNSTIYVRDIRNSDALYNPILRKIYDKL
jgi:hypothetical protein